MSFEYVRKLPDVKDILSEIPLPNDLKNLKAEKDREITGVFKRENNKFIVVIGPCSADNENALCEYVSRLSKLQDRVKERLILIPRIYTNKPRTTGEGYKGMAHQPNPNDAPNIVEGIKAIRRMHIRAMKESGLPAADEMLYPDNYSYLEDLLGYVAIGARSVENQQHRLTVSGMDIPVGMKNPTGGDLMVMLNSVYAAQLPHIFSYNGWEVKAPGNPLTHCILRGAVNQYGQSIPNYHYEDLMELSEKYQSGGYKNPTIIVDVNHANSNKKYHEQPRIAMEVMRSRRNSDLLQNMVRGLMIESYLLPGSQKTTETVYGKSITDPCMGWEEAERLVLDLADALD